MTYETSVALLSVVLLYALVCLLLGVKGIREDRRPAWELKQRR